MMKEFIKKRLLHGITLMGMVAAFMFYATPVHADPAVANISGGGNVGVGDSVSVTVSINTEKGLWGVEGTLDYDPAVLKYVKGNGATVNGGNGSVKYVQEYDGSSKKTSITVTFEAVGTGSAEVNLKSCVVSDEDDDYDCKGGKATVKVTADSPTPASSQAAQPSSQAAQPSSQAQTKKNTNAALSSLTVAPGTLSPAFKSNVYEYTVEVAEGVKALTVSAKTQESTAKVKSVNGAKSIEHGENTVTVITTAESGATLTYKLKVYCGVKAPNSGDDVTVTEVNVTAAGKQYKVAAELPEGEVAKGFEASTTQYNGKDIRILKNESMNLSLVYLVGSGEDEKGYFVFDEYNTSFYPFIKRTLSDEHYAVMLNPDAAPEVPEAVSVKNVEFNGQSFYACARNDGLEPDMLYVYMTDDTGSRGWYRYDTKYDSVQRFNMSLLGDPQELKDLRAETEEMKFQRLLMLIAGGAMIVVIIVLIIALAMKGRRDRDDYDDYDDYDDNYKKPRKPEDHKAVKTIMAKEEQERAKVKPRNEGRQPQRHEKEQPTPPVRPEIKVVDNGVKLTPKEEMIIERLKGEPEEQRRPEPKPEYRPEPKPEYRPEPKPEYRPEPKPEYKPEPKPEYKPEPKPEPKPGRAPEKNPAEGRKKKDMKFEMIDFDD